MTQQKQQTEDVVDGFTTIGKAKAYARALLLELIEMSSPYVDPLSGNTVIEITPELMAELRGSSEVSDD